MKNPKRLDPTGRRSIVTKAPGKVNAMAYAHLMQLLMQGTRTCAELAADTGLHVMTIYDYTYHLHKANVIHICMWDGTGRQQTRIYMLGDKADVPRPSKTRQQIAEEYRARKSAKQLLQRMAGATHDLQVSP
jgi:hypothetical protein